uniref:GDP-D-glucose phosphorylase 1 n=1 Tax=Globisporangium ultimum (strain ATCC 200006 / CBS 805.95 / DAOM BR144) TaxID=431595 RepID=K3WUF2_GLOUD
MSDFRAFLVGKWDAAAAAAGMLRSSPSEAKRRILDGSLQLLVQYNPAHIAISHDEVLCELRFPDDDTENKEGTGQLQFEAPTSEVLPQHAVLINVSPLVRYWLPQSWMSVMTMKLMRGHSLFVLDLPLLKPQRLDKKLLQYGIEVVDAMHDPHFALGFNSSGAWASVNHFHLQGFLMDELHGLLSGSPKRFPILNQQRSERFRFGSVVVYDFPSWPMRCYAVGIDTSTTQQKSKDSHERDALVNSVWRFVELLQTRNVAHNALIAHDELDSPLVIVFPRQLQRESGLGLVEHGRDVTTTAVSSSGGLRFAIAELAGLVIAGNERTFHGFTQDQYARILETELSLSEDEMNDLTALWRRQLETINGNLS